jgi:STE24 endopeptidase
MCFVLGNRKIEKLKTENWKLVYIDSKKLKKKYKIMANTIFIIIIAILVFNYFFERILDYLNSTFWSNELPKELEDIYDSDKYRKSQDYEKTKHRFSLIVNTISFVIILFILFFKGFGLLDDFIRQYTDNSILLALLFFGIIGLVADILSIPFSAYGTFVIEEKFGFNKTTVRTFILDKIKGLILGAVIGGGLLSLIVWIYDTTANMFWVYVWIVLSIFSIFMTMFYSILIVPIFNKQTPLDQGELRDAIEKFAQKAGFKLKNIYVINGSKRSKKSNAYFSGLGTKKRIVLYDTLIKNHTIEELVAVLAHEIGHYKKKHILLNIVLSVAQTGLMLFVLSLFIQKDSSLSLSLAQSLGAKESSFYIGILAFGLLYSPISLLLGIIMNAISRKHEFEADHFSGEKYNPESLQSALKKLSVDNLSNLNPHPYYVFVYYSHPTLLQRLKALDALKH